MKKGIKRFGMILVICLAVSAVLFFLLPGLGGSADGPVSKAAPEFQGKAVQVSAWDETARRMIGDGCDDGDGNRDGNLNSGDFGAYLFHNGGLAMDWDLFAAGESAEDGHEGSHGDSDGEMTDMAAADSAAEKSSLVAVYVCRENGVAKESYYFTTTPKEDLENLKKRVMEEQTRDWMYGASSDDESDMMETPQAIREYFWDYGKADEGNGKENDVEATLATRLSFYRETSEMNVDGKEGSLWSVYGHSLLQKKKAAAVKNCELKLRMNEDGQDLLSYSTFGGPLIRESWSITLGKEGLSHERSGGQKIEDHSSLYDGYAKWRYDPETGTSEHIYAAPYIMATNTSGDMVIYLSQSSALRRFLLSETYSTGEIRIALPDRDEAGNAV